MTYIEWAILIVAFFFTSFISVVTGSTSLITVPVMFQLGVEPRTALATNMLALTFMSVGGTIPFLRSDVIDRRRLPRLVVLTLIGSVLGALLVLVIPAKAMPLIISIAMISVAAFSLINRKAGVSTEAEGPSQKAEWGGYAATFALGIYGGFFSGGYVTILTAVYIALFRMKFIQAVATTKAINVFSSLVATFIFWRQGLIDFQLGAVLSVAAFAGSLAGARMAMRLSNTWLRRVFLTAVIVLALKPLVYDLWRT